LLGEVLATDGAHLPLAGGELAKASVVVLWRNSRRSRTIPRRSRMLQ